MSKTDRVYVVGFPKSGNTWLVMMLAKLLNFQVEEKPMGGDTIDIAACVNCEIDEPKGIISKNHLMSSDFFKEESWQGSKIIYVYRDIRPVIVSSYFYFVYQGDKKFLRNRKFPNLAVFPRLLKARDEQGKFDEYIKEFLAKGTAGSKFGSWSDHVQSWIDCVNNKESINLVSYQSLIEDPYRVLRYLVGFLGENVSESKYRKVIASESINHRKSLASKMHREQAAYSLSYYKSFFRSGDNKDWKEYINEKQENYIMTQCLVTKSIAESALKETEIGF